MTSVLDVAVLLVTAAGLVSAAVVLAATREPRQSLPVLLDLLTAAGLLRLAADPEWHRLASAAAVVALRHVVGVGLGLGGTPPGSPTEPGRYVTAADQHGSPRGGTSGPPGAGRRIR